MTEPVDVTVTTIADLATETITDLGAGVIDQAGVLRAPPIPAAPGGGS